MFERVNWRCELNQSCECFKLSMMCQNQLQNPYILRYISIASNGTIKIIIFIKSIIFTKKNNNLLMFSSLLSILNLKI